MSKRIVADKKRLQPLDRFSRGQALFVYEDVEGGYVLADDGHHRFVAALEAHCPVVLISTGAGGSAGITWRDVTWGNF